MACGPRLSVVIPVRDEEGNVEELASRLLEVLKGSGEVIFVDDGSRDSTWERLRGLHLPARIRLIRLRRNFGKTVALQVGFAATRGSIVVTMDGDLQDDPTEMPRLVAKLEEGFGVVSGWKKKRRDPLSKVAASRVFNWAVRCATGVRLHDVNCGFKAYRGDLARGLRLWGDMHRFIPVLLAADGHRVGELPVRHHPRRHGRSKYGFGRLFKGFTGLIEALLATRSQDRQAGLFAALPAVLVFLSAAAVWAYASFPSSSRAWASVAGGLLLSAIVLATLGSVARRLAALRSQPAEVSGLIEEQLD